MMMNYGGGSSGSGTAFPASPTTNQRFYRTDHAMDFYYDGTRWLSTQLFKFTASFDAITAATGTYWPVPGRANFGCYLVDLVSASYRVGAGEWDTTLRWADAANAHTTIVERDGSGDSSGTWADETTAINAVLDASARKLQILMNERSGTSSFYGGGYVTYRLIAT